MKKNELLNLSPDNIKSEEVKNEKKELVEKTKIEKTPFELVKLNESNLGFIAFGNHMLTEPIFEYTTECYEYLKEFQWEVITKISIIIADSFTIKN